MVEARQELDAHAPAQLHVLLVLDESASMEPYARRTVDAVRAYLSSVHDTAGRVTYTLTLFSDAIRQGPVMQSLAHVHDALDAYRPSGRTALYDAIGTTLDEFEEHAHARQVTAHDRMLCVIMTDGGENSSRRYSGRKVAAMIGARTRANRWTFVFLSAAADFAETAARLKIPECNAAHFSTDAVEAAVRRLSERTAAFVHSGMSSHGFFLPGPDLGG
jgi:Mg-chelatase subunit ChlD